MPLSTKPDLGKVSEYSGESSPSKSPNVLHERDSRSKLANETRKLSPESGSLTVQAGTLAGERDILAGEPAADGVDSIDAGGSKPGSIKVPYVMADRHSGPVMRQHAPAERVDLAERCGAESGSLQAEAEAADP